MTSKKVDRRIIRKHGTFKTLELKKCRNRVAAQLQKVRRIEESDKGFCKCVTCDTWAEWQTMEGGHYISRRYSATCLVPENIWPQCNFCNQHLSGNLGEYRKFLGTIADELEQLKKKTRQFDKIELATYSVLLDDVLAERDYTDSLHRAQSVQPDGRFLNCITRRMR